MTKEEAIRRIKSWNLDSDDMDVLSVVIPELHESEDEKFQKYILKVCKECVEANDKGLELSMSTTKKLLSYLEKQKESTWTKEDESFRIHILPRILNPKGWTMEQIETDRKRLKEFVERQKNKWLEKQKEQKPIFEVFGFKVGDAVRLKDGDGRKHIIKSFEEVKGVHGPNFYHVEFEDNSARDGIYPGEEYPNGYYTQMEKFEEEQKPNIELIQRSWYMEGYNDRKFGNEPKWIIKTGEGGPRHELNPRYGQPLAEEQKPVEYLSKRKVYDIMNKLTELSTSDLIPIESEEYVRIHEITSDVCSLLNYPIEQKSKKFKLGDKVHWHDDDTNVITITGFREDAYLTDSAYGPILFCDEDNWERIEQKPAEYADDIVEEAEEYTSKVACGDYGVEVTEAYIAGVLSERNRGTEWSENDEAQLDDIEKAISNYYDLNHAPQHQYWLEQKLKSLRLQSKQGWSEKDNIMLENIILCLKEYCLTDEITWLKSLRPPLKDKEMKLKILKYLSTRCSSLEFEEVEDYLNNLRPS